MKHLLFVFISSFYLSGHIHAQDAFIPENAGVIAIESRNVAYDAMTLGNIMRNEMIKTGLFNVIDRHDTQIACEYLKIKPENCLGSQCILKVGHHMGMDKMFSGSIDQYSGKIIITLRSVDVLSGKVDNNYIQEFVDLEENIPTMIGLCLKKMYDQEVDKDLWMKLTEEDSYESAVNSPDITKLSLSGPRMGVAWISGEDGQRLQDQLQDGGYEAWPVMSQFGYQFEVSYLNQGNIQALFEFVPTITGLEQGLFIPSISILHGIRSNINGLEFAFGPVFMLTKRAKGFDLNGKWFLEEEKSNFPDEDIVLKEKLDDRGKRKLESGLVVAFGKTFKSGKVNFPVNLVAVVKKSGMRLGLSFGFNARN